MAFTSWTFLALVAAAVILYYAVPKRVQWVLLLAASAVFYAVSYTHLAARRQGLH